MFQSSKHLASFWILVVRATAAGIVIASVSLRSVIARYSSSGSSFCTIRLSPSLLAVLCKRQGLNRRFR